MDDLDYDTQDHWHHDTKDNGAHDPPGIGVHLVADVFDALAVFSDIVVQVVQSLMHAR